MRAMVPFLVSWAPVLQRAFGFPGSPHKRSSIDDFAANEEPVALAGLLCNIGSNGCEARGVPSGVVLASPSRSDPDYWYTWTRDAALVFKAIIERFSLEYDENLQGLVHDYITAQVKLQGVSSPSGTLVDGSGLGEAKFNADLIAFTGGWGRPQRDGPALRAIAIIQYAKWLVVNGYGQTAATVVWPVIKNDLSYVAQYWNSTGFDLWEEVSGSSFFTVASQYRALVEGSVLASEFGSTCEACISIAPQILCFQQSFWSSAKGAIVSNINTNNGRGGLDANSILASIHSFDPFLGCDSSTFQPCSDKALSNHKAVTDSFRIWPINQGIARGEAVAVGRYVEDVYYGGNPWYISTFAAAEQLYDALRVWEAQGSLKVTPISLSFFEDFSSSISAGTYASTTRTYQNLVAKISAYADGYLAIVQKYLPPDGHMAEQYDKSTGSPLSARDLTWSYASFLTAVSARKGSRSNYFGWAADAAFLPSSCRATFIQGAYMSATATTFPSSIVPNGGDETVTDIPADPTPTACLVSVTFNERVPTVWGDTIKVVGSIEALGNWNPGSGVPLSASKYTDSDPLWSLTISMAAGERFQYKFIKLTEDGTVTWESDPNRSYSLPATCGGSVAMDGSWHQ